MQEYTIFEIRCNKGMKIADIYHEIIKRIPSHNRNLFAFHHLDWETNGIKSKALYEKIGLERFAYTAIPPAWENRDEIPDYIYLDLVSNLDNRWEMYNKTNHESLSKSDFEDVIEFADSLKKYGIFQMIIGLDEISWDGNGVSSAAHHLDPVNFTSLLGKYYCSNSIIIGRTLEGMQYKAYLSCEKKYSDHPVVEEIIHALGQVSWSGDEKAPANEAERDALIEIWETNLKKVENIVNGISALPLKNISRPNWTFEQMNLEFEKKINTKKCIKQFLCTDGWYTRKAQGGEIPTVIAKKKGEDEVCLMIKSSNGGHSLQALCGYHLDGFSYYNNILELSPSILDETGVETFFQNAVMIRDHLYKEL